MAGSPMIRRTRALSILAFVVIFINSAYGQNHDTYSNTLAQFSHIIQAQNLKDQLETLLGSMILNTDSETISELLQSVQNDIHHSPLLLKPQTRRASDGNSTNVNNSTNPSNSFNLGTFLGKLAGAIGQSFNQPDTHRNDTNLTQSSKPTFDLGKLFEQVGQLFNLPDTQRNDTNQKNSSQPSTPTSDTGNIFNQISSQMESGLMQALPQLFGAKDNSQLLSKLPAGLLTQLPQLMGNVPPEELKELSNLFGKLPPELLTQLPQLMGIIPPKMLKELPNLLGKLPPELLTQLPKLIGNIPPEILKELPQLLGQIPPQMVKQLLQLLGKIPPQILGSLLHSFTSNNKTGNSTSGIMSFLNNLPDFAKLLGSGNSSSSEFKISDSCVQDLNLFRAGLTRNKQWAFRMIDSLGKPSSGIMEGNIKWSGSYDECKRINSDIDSPFDGKYCHINVPVPLPGVLAYLGGMQIGVCMPKSCSNDDMTNAWNLVLSQVTELRIKGTGCEEEKEYDTKAIIVLCVCGFILALMIFATIFDVFFVETERKQRDNDEVKIQRYKTDLNDYVDSHIQMEGKVNNGYVYDIAAEAEEGKTEQNGDVTNDKETDISTSADTVNGDVTNNKENNISISADTFNYKPSAMDEPGVGSLIKTPDYNPGLVAKLILSFSVYTNGRKLLNAEKTGGSLGSVNGIRFISMSWVILGHSIAFTLGSMNNGAYIYPTYLSRWTFMAITNALLSVDTFFVLSGLLLAYVFMKEMKREKGRINWFMFYFHRFWRLTPPFMLVMMVNITLSRYFGDGPGFPKDGYEQDFCRTTWWHNLLYINNFFFQEGGGCLAWSWYLANDMQFYIVSPLMLVPLYFSDRIGKIIVGIFMFGMTTAAITVSAVLELPASMYSIVPSSKSGDYFSYYYVRPYCRMGPYLAGLFTGYVLYKTKCKVKMTRVVNLFCWLMAILFACTVLYGVFEETKGNHMSVPIAAIYNGTSRTIWGICVCWVVFSCCTGHGGFVDEFLSWQAFIPLGRLTYCAYLVHPIIIFTYNFTLRETFHASEIAFTYIYLASLVLAYGFAFLTSLAFESPMMGLEKAIFKRGKK